MGLWVRWADNCSCVLGVLNRFGKDLFLNAALWSQAWQHMGNTIVGWGVFFPPWAPGKQHTNFLCPELSTLFNPGNVGWDSKELAVGRASCSSAELTNRKKGHKWALHVLVLEGHLEGLWEGRASRFLICLKTDGKRRTWKKPGSLTFQSHAQGPQYLHHTSRKAAGIWALLAQILQVYLSGWGTRLC